MMHRPLFLPKQFSKKKYFLLILIIGLLLTAARPLFFAPGLSNAEPIAAYLNEVFPSEIPTGSETVEASYTLENAFPNLTFIDPVDMIELPGGNEFLIVGLQGHVWKISNDATSTSKELLLDISENTVVNTDGGMMGIAIHPEYGQQGSPNAEYIYLFYRYSPDATIDPDFSGSALTGYMRLSRFNLPLGANKINPSSEYPMIQVFDRHDWHNGGDMFFGNDGFLYVSVGDEGAANDSYNVTQQIDNGFFGGVFRLDVNKKGGDISHPIRRQPLDAGTPPSGWPSSFTQGYYIPNDNPWQDPNGGILEEFYAIGTRSPHRMTYDPLTEDIWIGDIGQGTMEEISIVRKGDNLQWPYMEGTANGPKAKPMNLIGRDKPPIHAFGRTVGRSVIGGFMYNGARYPELNGKYFFGDHETQNVWTINRTGENSGNVNFLLNVPVNGQGSKDGISSFYVDSKEYIYVLDLFGTNRDGGVIHKLVRTSNIPDPPEKLSDLGVFTNLQTLETISGIVPYDVNTPLWSDGAKKRRWIALPNNGTHDEEYEQITFEKEENWIFPSGTVMIKHFDLPTDENNPSKLTKLETRFVIFTKNDDIYAVTYKWNEEGTDAFLVGIDEAPTEDYTITKLDGSTSTQTWDFPSRQQCIQCHNSVAGYALGVKSRQLNKDFTYSSTGITANQLETWNHLNMFNKNIGDYKKIPAHANLNNTAASEEMRVRSYVDANCAYCHRPNGVEGAFDGRSLTALYDQNMINAQVVSHASPTGQNIIVPGNTENSVLWMRDVSTGTDRMPPVGRRLIDKKYINLLNSWINTLDNNGPEVIENGWYNLQVKHSNYYLTVENANEASNTNIIQNEQTDGDEQKWHIQDVGERKYRIMSGNANKVMAAQDLRSGRGATVVQEDWTGDQQQLWYFEDTSEGYYRIRNAYNNLDLDVFSGKTTAGLRLITWTPHGGGNQQFKTIPVDEPMQNTCLNPIEEKLSAIEWTDASVGWGQVMQNTNLRGDTISINGKTYDTGISAHAQSELIYDINGKYNEFITDIGVDDTAPANSKASVQFEVIGDDKSLYKSPVMGDTDDAISVIVDVTGVNQLKLIVHELPELSPASDPDRYDHSVWAGAYFKSCEQTEDTCPKAIEDQLSAIEWTSTSVGWGQVVQNTNLRGDTISINGKTYDTGISAHAQSELIYDINGKYNKFITDIGVDDTAPANSKASVQFEVIGDAKSLYKSPVMGDTDDAISIAIDVTGVNQLKLIVHELPELSPASDPDRYDHSVWAGAYFKGCEQTEDTCPNPLEEELSSLNWLSASVGYGTARHINADETERFTINGKKYEQLLFSHAQSEIIYLINSQYEIFTSDIGVTDTAPANSKASVQFEVIGDDKSLYKSPVMGDTDDAISIVIDVTGVNQLKLIVHELPELSPVSDPDRYDHAAWADANFTGCKQTENTAALFAWSDLKAEVENSQVNLTWSVENQEQIASYKIEHSVNKKEFTLVTDLISTALEGVINYEGIDENPIIGTNYYRIIAIDNNGVHIPSELISVNFVQPSANVLAYPNPVSKEQLLTVDVHGDYLENLTIRIFDIQGRLLETRTKKMVGQQHFEQFEITNLKSGIYLIQLNGENWSQTKRIVVK